MGNKMIMPPNTMRLARFIRLLASKLSMHKNQAISNPLMPAITTRLFKIAPVISKAALRNNKANGAASFFVKFNFFTILFLFD